HCLHLICLTLKQRVRHCLCRVTFLFSTPRRRWDQDNAPARFNGWDTEYWTPNNPTNVWHQPGNSGPYKRSLFYRDVSFIKIGYMTLGYTLPRGLVDRLGLGSLRVYATAQNPFVFTDYEGWDPESAGRNSWGSAFLSRTLMAGVNLRF
ncbi:MAG: hypothetical protein AAF223_00670, partial [Bacteroidota bacterium]